RKARAGAPVARSDPSLHNCGSLKLPCSLSACFFLRAAREEIPGFAQLGALLFLAAADVQQPGVELGGRGRLPSQLGGSGGTVEGAEAVGFVRQQLLIRSEGEGG